MKRPLKWLLWLIATPVVLLILLFIIGGLFINTIARRGIEGGATYALGVSTTLGSASVGIFSGTFGLSNLNVANPKGYAAGKFMSLGDGKVAVSLGSLTKDTIEVPSFALDTIELNLEKKDGKANYQVIMDNLAKLSTKPGTEPAKKPADQGGGKKLIIKELTIRHVIVHADLAGMGGAVGGVINQAAAVTIPIDEVKLQDVGKGTGKGVADSGVTVGQLSSIIVQAVLAAAVEKGGSILPKDVLGDLQGGLKQLDGLKDVGVQVIGKAGETAQQIGKGLQDAVDQGAKQIDSIGKGLKDLIPGKK